MELDTFITEAINSVIKGVGDAKIFAAEHNAVINPYVKQLMSVANDPSYFESNDGHKKISKINFDIAVTVATNQQTGVNGGIKIYALNIGGSSTDNIVNQTVSRIQFSIEVVLP